MWDYLYLASIKCIFVKQLFLNLPIIDLLEIKSLTLPVPEIFPFLNKISLVSKYLVIKSKLEIESL